MKRDARFKPNFNYHDVNEANLINYSETNLFEYSFELVFKDQLNRQIKNCFEESNPFYGKTMDN